EVAVVAVQTSSETRLSWCTSDWVSSNTTFVVDTVGFQNAVALLTPCQMQLDDFEVVATSQVPGLDVVIFVYVQLLVANANSQRAVCVLQSACDHCCVFVIRVCRSV